MVPEAGGRRFANSGSHLRSRNATVPFPQACGGFALKAASLRLATSLEGLSADTVALILTIGLVLGLFPVYGCATILCALAGLVLRLNLPALQLVNQLVTPLQLVLLVPFARLGARLLNSPGSATQLARGLGLGAVHAVAGWLCVCLPLGIVVYFALGHILRDSVRGRCRQLASSSETTQRSLSLPTCRRSWCWEEPLRPYAARNEGQQTSSFSANRVARLAERIPSSKSGIS